MFTSFLVSKFHYMGTEAERLQPLTALLCFLIQPRLILITGTAWRIDRSGCCVSVYRRRLSPCLRRSRDWKTVQEISKTQLIGRKVTRVTCQQSIQS